MMQLMAGCVCQCLACVGYGGHCLAGIGDNDFSIAPKEEIIKRLDEGKGSDYDRKIAKDILKSEYNHDYEDLKIL